MPVHLGLFLLALIALLAARGQVDQWAAAGQDVSRVTAAFNHPFAAALLLALMAATAYTSPAPLAVKQLLSALALAPMIIVARPVVSAPLVPVLYTLGVLFALDTLRHAFGGHPPSLARSSSFRSRLSALSYWLGCCAAEGCREQAAMPQTRANGCCGGSSPA